LLSGQGELGVFAGISNYQGDLASYSLQGGFKALIGPVIGVHGGYELNRSFQLRADLLYTRLAGDDALAEKEETRQRNLDFFAPVIQLAVGADWNILGLSSSEVGSFTPYITAGVSIFYFNPRTVYMGDKVALHPLGTEGQYLDDYPDQKPYSLFQTTLQLGGGLKLIASEQIILAIEGMFSYTFTDYIDDASTIYIPYPVLLEKSGALTAALGNRIGEYLGTDPVILPENIGRSNAESKDYFGIFTLRASMPIEISTNKFKIRRHNNKTIDNPKF
jgi:hypothetical protein